MEHGTRSRYVHEKCRCSPCTTANRVYRQQRRLVLMQQPVPEHVHGTLNGYNNYCCTCERCVAAKAIYNRFAAPLYYAQRRERRRNLTPVQRQQRAATQERRRHLKGIR